MAGEHGAAWNRDPSRFTQGDKRKERRQRARQRRLGGSPAILANRHLTNVGLCGAVLLQPLLPPTRQPSTRQAIGSHADPS